MSHILSVEIHFKAFCGLNICSLMIILSNQIHYDLRKFDFSNRIINVWNSLPDSVVAVNNLNLFKSALDIGQILDSSRNEI